jgi:uncharacterized protein with von Willebrand factor type A (vWA) domain
MCVCAQELKASVSPDTHVAYVGRDDLAQQLATLQAKQQLMEEMADEQVCDITHTLCDLCGLLDIHTHTDKAKQNIRTHGEEADKAVEACSSATT